MRAPAAATALRASAARATDAPRPCRWLRPSGRARRRPRPHRGVFAELFLVLTVLTWRGAVPGGERFLAGAASADAVAPPPHPPCRRRRSRSRCCREAASDAAPRRRRALAAPHGRACALARRHFRVPSVPAVIPRSVPACSPLLRLFPGCSRGVAGQPPPRLGAAMPVAAAAPLISSVQKLVLYETRAVSSIAPRRRRSRGCGRRTARGGCPGPPACWLGPALLLPRRGCSLSKTTPYLSFRLLGSASFWPQIQNSPRTEKKKVLNFLFSLCLCPCLWLEGPNGL